MASLLLLFFRIESSPEMPVFQEGLCQILQILVRAHRLHQLRLLRPHHNGPLAPPPRISPLAPLPDRLVVLMAVEGCVHDPALAPRVPLVAQARHGPLALAVVPVAARVPAVPAVAQVVVAPAAMGRAVAAEAGHMAVAMATDHRQPRHARRQPPSSRAGRSRFRRRSSSKTWRNCSMSRSMR
jgi:hypothetical protein